VAKTFDYSGLIFKIIYKIRMKFNLRVTSYLVLLKMRLHGVTVGSSVKFIGFPMVRREPGSSIIFGDNCRFNSSRNSVRIGQFKPCTFATISKDAEIVFGSNSGATGVTMAAVTSIRIGNNVMIGSNCTIVDNDFHNPDPAEREMTTYPSRPVVIRDNVFLGFNCFVLKGVTIGENSVIGANSVVVTNIPPNSIAMGNPCKVIMRRNWTGSPEKDPPEGQSTSGEETAKQG